LMSKTTQAILTFTEALNLDSNNMEAKFYRSLSFLDSGLLKRGDRGAAPGAAE